MARHEASTANPPQNFSFRSEHSWWAAKGRTFEGASFVHVHDIQVKRHLDSEDLSAVTGLLTAASEADAHPALGEHAWLDLVQGGREGFAGLVAWEQGHAHPVGYAQLSLGPDGGGDGPSWALEVVVDPHHRIPGNTVAIRSCAQRHRADLQRGRRAPAPMGEPAGPLSRPDGVGNGLVAGRSLYQMRRPLPDASTPRCSPGLQAGAGRAVVAGGQ